MIFGLGGIECYIVCYYVSNEFIMFEKKIEEILEIEPEIKKQLKDFKMTPKFIEDIITIEFIDERQDDGLYDRMSDDEEFTPYNGIQYDEEFNQVWATQGEQIDIIACDSACDSECGFCGKCDN